MGIKNSINREPPVLLAGKLQGVTGMIKSDIVNDVAAKTGLPKCVAQVAVEALFDAMKSALRRGQRIELRGFGIFVVKRRKRGVGRNPRTGQAAKIPPGMSIRFKPGKGMQP